MYTLIGEAAEGQKEQKISPDKHGPSLRQAVGPAIATLSGVEWLRMPSLAGHRKSGLVNRNFCERSLQNTD